MRPAHEQKSKPSRHRRPSEIIQKNENKKPKRGYHKMKSNEGSQAVALREALVKLQELELQSTENRAKVGAVSNRVAEFMYAFESQFTGKNAVSPEDYQMFQDEMRDRMDTIVSNISDHSLSTMKLLTSTSEGLVAASVAAAAAEKDPENEDGSGSSGQNAETVLEQVAEEFQDIFTTSKKIRERLEKRLNETQHHLALAHDEEHAAKREVAKMQLQVANSKAEIRRVWNEAQEKLKVSKYTQKESSFTRSGSLTQP